MNYEENRSNEQNDSFLPLPNNRSVSADQSLQSNISQTSASLQQSHKKIKPKQYQGFFFSHVLDQTFSQDEDQMDPQFMRVKNNILLILISLAAYGVYQLIGNFIDYLIIGYLAGLAYHQTRGKFTKIIMSPQTYQGYSQPLHLRFIKAFLLLSFAFILPRLRYLLSNPDQLQNFLKLKDYLLSFWLNRNITVILCQIFSVLCAFYFLLGPHLKKIGQKLRPTNVTCIRFTFGFFTVAITLSIIALVPAVLFKQIGQVGVLAQQKIQQKFNCQIISFDHKTNSSLPLCSEKYVTSNAIIKQTIEEFRNQNQTVQICKAWVRRFQIDYIGYNIFHYDDIACTWYSIIAKASNYSAIHTHTSEISTASWFSTGTSLFKNVFGSLTWVIGSCSNILFYFTIMMTTFVLTTKIPNRYFTIKEIFSQNKQQLIGSITSLIQATFLIVFWHFAASIILLQLFAFTPVNLIVAILLSSMAFIPYFRPWFGIFFIVILRVIFIRSYYISFVFLGIYYYMSQYIYSFHYNKMEFHQIITNMSVLFGIYRFGISGIIYGPLIIIMYSVIQKQLLKKYRKKKNSNQNKRLQRDEQLWQKQRQKYLNQKKETSLKVFQHSQKQAHKHSTLTPDIQREKYVNNDAIQKQLFKNFDG